MPTLSERIEAARNRPHPAPATPNTNGHVPISARIYRAIAEGVPVGGQRQMATAIARASLGKGDRVETAADYVWLMFKRSPVGEVAHPWTFEDACEIVENIQASPAPPLRNPKLKEPQPKRERTVVLDEKDPTNPAHPEHLTDLGNALRLVRLFGTEIRYVHVWHTWLVWDGARWRKDDNGGLDRMARGVVHALLGEAQRAEGDAREKLYKFALKTESRDRLKAMVSIAEHDERVIVAVEALDTQAWLLNCTNGTVDLRTMTLQTHRKEDLLTKTTGVAWRPEATSERLERFLTTAIPDADLRHFLQKCGGLASIGARLEKVLIFLYGAPHGGKSTFLNLLYGALGEYAKTTGFETWLASRGEPIPNDIAALVGVRAVLSSEASRYRSINAERVKAFTGGDPISARFMRAEFFTYVPQSTLIWASNDKPKISSDETGLWVRMKMVPFNEVLPEEQRDKLLIDDLLRDEGLREAALAWVLAGAAAYQTEGLGTCAAVEQAIGAYQREMDVFAQFLEDRCVEGGEQRAKFAALTEALRVWVSEQSLSPRRYNRAWLKEELTRRAGFEIKNPSNVLVVYGVGLKDITPEGRSVELSG